MPFDATNGVIVGDDARFPELWAKVAFQNWLKALLNDASGPYAARLGLRLSPPFTAPLLERKAIVTDNRKAARTMFSAKSAPPVFYIFEAKAGDWTRSGARVGGVQKRGKRYEITLGLDMGIGDATPGAVDVVSEENDDSILPAVLCDAVRSNYGLLCERGFNNPAIMPDGSRDGGRAPHNVTFFVIALDED